MADEETNEGEIAPEGEGDSAPFRAAIARAEAAEAELKVIAEERQTAELAAQQRRETALDVIVNARQIPNLKEDLLRWVEGDITEQSVETALQAKGLNFVQPTVETQAFPESVIEEPQPAAPQLSVTVPVSELGQQVADAAGGQTAKTLDQQIAGAQTKAEVVALMDEAGASVSYT
jgi:hypothetical protein